MKPATTESRVKMHGISQLIDSDMEEVTNILDENSILSSASESANVGDSKTVAKKPRKRKPVTMPKKTRVMKTSPKTTSKQVNKKPSSAKLKALEEKVVEEMSQAEDDEENTIPTAGATSKRGRPTTKTKPTNRKVVEKEDAMEVEGSPIVARSSSVRTRVTAPTPKPVIKKAATKKSSAEPKSQEMDVDSDLNDLQEKPIPNVRVRTESRQRQDLGPRKRAGSASDTERGDPNLRRKLGDITLKIENIDMKYRALKEVGINEASANVEKLRRQCEAITEASNKHITSLKKELAMQAPLAHDARKMRKTIESHDIEMTRLKDEKLQLNTSLVAAQNEIKALQAKLAAARKASVEPQSKTPGSAIKNSTMIRAVPVSSNENQQLAQMKLDLYGDLTGLIIRSVKKAEDGDTYDCIQTGRNGTLHFKLFVDQEDAKTATFEETEFLYTPLLDGNRDRDMIELMPPYLTEEITFARQNAAKFYQRVVDTLTRRIEA